MDNDLFASVGGNGCDLNGVCLDCGEADLSVTEVVISYVCACDRLTVTDKLYRELLNKLGSNTDSLLLLTVRCHRYSDREREIR